MVSIIANEGIVIRGKQRVAVYHALKTPSTGRSILAQAKQAAPSMTYQDLRHILRSFQRNGIAVCLNPDNTTGRFYVLSEYRTVLPEVIEHIKLCAKICRAKTRLAVLKEAAMERYFEPHPLTATQIKKYLRETYPLGLNHVIAALKFLKEHRLVEVAGYTDKRELKIYRITDLGKTILTHVTQINP